MCETLGSITKASNRCDGGEGEREGGEGGEGGRRRRRRRDLNSCLTISPRRYIDDKQTWHATREL
jgi:hypothetical protein